MQRYELKKHQKEAVDFFRKSGYPGSFFWHSMGLGKSLSSLHIANHVRKLHEARGDSVKTMIICPKSIQLSWEDEIRKFCPEERKNYIILPYTQTQNFIHQAKFTDIRMLIVDEFHYLRNPNTKRLENFIKLLIALSYGPKNFENGRIIGLSGTLLHNEATDIYNLFALFSSKSIREAVMKLMDGQGRRRWSNMFQNRYVHQGRIKFSGLKNQPVLTELFSPILHKKKLTDCTDLPEKTLQHVDLGISDDALLANVDVNSPTHYMSELEALSRAKTPHLVDWIGNFIEETDEDEQLVLFSMYKAPLLEVKDYFPQGEVELITGDQSLGDRQIIIRRFQEKKVRIIGMTYACGAEGLNLQGCRYAVYHSYPWTAALFEQAQARIHRSGQQNATVHYVLTSGKHDKHIFNTVMRKSKTADKFDKAIK